MGQTLAEKIISRASGHEVHAHRVALFVDHVAPACNVSTADGQVIIRRFAPDQGSSSFSTRDGASATKC